MTTFDAIALLLLAAVQTLVLTDGSVSVVGSAKAASVTADRAVVVKEVVTSESS